MAKKINLLTICEGNYAKELLDYLFCESLISTAYVHYYYYSDTKIWDSIWKSDNKYIHDGRVKFCSQEIEYRFLYDKICDYAKLPSLSKDLMEKMLPYESMIMKLARRRYGNFPIVEYEDAKMDYHKILRFWNYIFVSRKINAVFLDALPHLSTSYVIYALALVKNIPILTCIDSVLVKRKTYTFGAIEDHGKEIGDHYNSVSKFMPADDIILDEDIRKFYERYSKPYDRISTDPVREKEKKELQKSEKKEYFGAYTGIRYFMKPYRHKAQEFIKSLFVYKNLDYFKRQKEALARIEKNTWFIKYYKKRQMMTLDEYDKIAKFPDYTKTYIYFALQLTPEGTVIPRTGVFGEQYTSIQLIARAAQKAGVYVYVKEHFVQAFRDRAVYKILSDIPNVRLIKSSVDAFELMHHCIATGTQTGTCLMESPLQGKPVVVTSSGYSWKGMPYVYEIKDENQGAKIIRQLKQGITVDRENVIRYLHAVQNRTVFYHFVLDQKEVGTEEYVKTIRDMKALVTRFINERCKFTEEDPLKVRWNEQ